MTLDPMQLDAKIDDALNQAVPDDLVRDVKVAIAAELEDLSPDAFIRFTDYHNHSYVPDMTIEWRGSGFGRRKREVFVRHSLRKRALARDIEALAEREPVVIGLSNSTDPADRVTATSVDAFLPASSRTLVANARSIPAIGRRSESPTYSMREEDRDITQPLLMLIKAGIIENGRGYLGDDEVDRLNSGVWGWVGSSSTDRAMTLNDSLAELFAEEAAVRIARMARLLQGGLADVFAIDFDRGMLSGSELRILLSFLLKHPQATRNQSFWRHLGSLMSLEDLLALSHELEGIDVTLLVRPNARSWRARRAQLAFDVTGDIGVDGGWSVSRQTLIGRSGGWHVALVTDARRAKGHHGGRPARWEQIRGPLGRFVLDSIRLRGGSRTISITAEASGDVKADVDRIERTIDDQFHVTDIVVRALGSPTRARMTVDFLEATITSAAGESVANLTDAGLSLLGHRRPWGSAGELLDGSDSGSDDE